MAHRFRPLSTAIWQDDSFFRAMDPFQRDVYIYFLTNSHVSVSGIYHTRLSLAARHFNWDPSDSRPLQPSTPEFLKVLRSIHPHVILDEPNQLVFVRDFLMLNGLRHGRPKLISNAVYANFYKHPSTDLWIPFLQTYPQFRSPFYNYLRTHPDLHYKLSKSLAAYIADPNSQTLAELPPSNFEQPKKRSRPKKFEMPQKPSQSPSADPMQPRSSQALNPAHSNDACNACETGLPNFGRSADRPPKFTNHSNEEGIEGGFEEGYREGGYKGGGEEGNPLGGGKGNQSQTFPGISGLPSGLHSKLVAAVQQSPFDSLHEALATFNGDFTPPRHFRPADLVSDHSLAKQLTQFLTEHFNPASRLLQQAGLSAYQLGHLNHLMPDLSKRLDYVREKINLAKQQDPDNPNPTLIYQALLNDYKPQPKIQQPAAPDKPSDLPANILPFDHPLLQKAKTIGLAPEEQQQLPPHYQNLMAERNGSYFLQA